MDCLRDSPHPNPIIVKWLGKDAITALAIDGKGGKAEMLEKVARWVAASGRNVSQPGAFGLSPEGLAMAEQLFQS